MAKEPKKLADILKTKNPFMRSKADAKFASSHTVTKLKNDQATEKDSQFVSDTPFFDRHIAHGYNPGEDEAQYDSYMKEDNVEEAHSENQAWQARQYHYDVASNLRSVAKRTEPGAIKAGSRELLGKFMLGGRKAALQRNKAERHDAQSLRRQADKHERAGDVAHEVMLKKRKPEYNQHKWNRFKINTPKPPKLSDMAEETSIKELLTKRQEEKRLKKKVMTADERKKYVALKKKDKK